MQAHGERDGLATVDTQRQAHAQRGTAAGRAGGVGAGVGTPP